MCRCVVSESACDHVIQQSFFFMKWSHLFIKSPGAVSVHSMNRDVWRVDSNDSIVVCTTECFVIDMNVLHAVQPDNCFVCVLCVTDRSHVLVWVIEHAHTNFYSSVIMCEELLLGYLLVRATDGRVKATPTPCR